MKKRGLTSFLDFMDALPGPYAWKFLLMRLRRQLAWAKIGDWWLVVGGWWLVVGDIAHKVL